jgi:hypothetical protein
MVRSVSVRPVDASRRGSRHQKGLAAIKGVMRRARKHVGQEKDIHTYTGGKYNKKIPKHVGNMHDLSGKGKGSAPILSMITPKKYKPGDVVQTDRMLNRFLSPELMPKISKLKGKGHGSCKSCITHDKSRRARSKM